ncbi:MAG: helix-turn-helix domain-containing protein [Lachnospiraceae bacterium]|nr:helix-turn-helix domain-containing protein [Lachnospiraceae bacterium]
MREELTKQINAAIRDELAAAKKKYPSNNSRHEGYAVLLEEFEEMCDELEDLDAYMDRIWGSTKRNVSTEIYRDYLERAGGKAHLLIAEAIQTAAMIDKMIEFEISQSKELKKPEKPKAEADSRINNIKTVKEIKWTPQQRADIQAIKEAHKTARSKVKEEGKLSDESKRGPKKRKDLDDAEIFRLKQNGMTLSQIAKKMGCCPQTVANRLKNIQKEG